MAIAGKQIKMLPSFMLVLQILSSLVNGCQSRALPMDSATIKSTDEKISWESGGYFEGDIVLNNGDDSQSDTQSAAIVGNNYRWPNAQIPFLISSQFTGSERRVISEVMNEYHKKTCIRFVDVLEIPWNLRTDFITIKKTGRGCFSNVGKQGGGQLVSLDDGCIYSGTVMHELMHAVGFFHEQSRTDRDDFITVHFDNIKPEHQHNFDKYDSTQVNLLNTTYDSKSLMHYKGYAFALNRNRPTITNKDGSPVQPNENYFTQTDILELNLLYHCANASQATTTPKPVPSSGGLDWKERINGQMIVSLANDCDFVGNDISKLSSSSDEECGKLCIAQPWCTHFTWIGSYCYLKYSVGSTDVYQHKGAICGWIVKRNESHVYNSESGFNWQERNGGKVTLASGCNFIGYDISEQQSTGEECGLLCHDNPQCTHFVWGVEDKCYLKSVVNSTASAVSGQGVCGWVNRSA